MTYEEVKNGLWRSFGHVWGLLLANGDRSWHTTRFARFVWYTISLIPIFFFEKVHMPCCLPYSASPGRALAVQGHDFAFYHVLEKLFLQSAMQLCGVKQGMISSFFFGIDWFDYAALLGSWAWLSKHLINQTESWAWLSSPLIIKLFEMLDDTMIMIISFTKRLLTNQTSQTKATE